MLGSEAGRGVDKGTGNGVSHQGAQSHSGAGIVGVCTVGEQNHADVVNWVDEHTGAGVAGVSVGFRREHVAKVAGIVGIDVPTKGASQRSLVAWHGAHGFHGKRTEDACSVKFAAILQGSAKYCQIFGSGEDAGVATDAEVHLAGKWVVYLPNEAHLSVLALLFGWSKIIAFCCRRLGFIVVGGDECVVGHHHVLVVYPKPRFLVEVAWQIVGVAHSQRLEDVVLCKLAQGFSADFFNYLLQSDEVKAAILKVGAWLEVARTG